MTVDELTNYGLEYMDEAAIDAFLDAESTGVLGLPTDGAPYLLPLSYVRQDGSLYFSYLLGEESRKRTLSDRGAEACFLVYRVDTQFTWRSVLLEGPLGFVPEAEWPAFDEHPRNAWRPNTLQTGGANIVVYELDVEERTGIQQRGLAPEFRENVSPKGE